MHTVCSETHAGSHVVLIDLEIFIEISYIQLALRLVVGGGFEPPKALPTDLQSVPFGRSGTPPEKVWSQRQESNPRPADYKSAALPTELLWPANNIAGNSDLIRNDNKASNTGL